MSASERDEFLELLFAEVKLRKSGVYQSQDYALTVSKWREVFSRTLHSKTGEWCLGGYDWHVFTFDYHDALTGLDAIHAYHALKGNSGYIFTHSTSHPRCCLAPELPSHTAISQALNRFPELADVYVMEEQGRWTFVATHEDKSGLGPFFALGDAKH